MADSAHTTNSSQRRKCCIEGCGRDAIIRSLCNRHYLAARAAKKLDEFPRMKRSVANGEPLRYLQSLVGDQRTECLIWPYSKDRDGYGVVGCFQSKLPSTNAHRLMCIWTHGNPPDEQHQASHACGVSSCVNPNHIRWLTVGDNNRERRVHGTMPCGVKSRSAKLTTEAVEAIRADTRRHIDIAKDYGCGQSHVSRIKLGKSRTIS